MHTENQMPSLPALLKQLEALHRQKIETEQKIAEVERAIVAVGKSEPKKRRRRAIPAETIELIKPTVKALRDAGAPLKPREIAALLGIAPALIPYRLGRAVEAGLVMKVGGGRYRVAAEVPAL